MKIDISFITSNDFRRLCPLVFVLNANVTSKHKYQCFLILVKSFTACTFSRIYALTVSNTNFHQFGHKFSAFKCPRQEAKTKTAAKQNYIHNKKKPRVFADEPPSANETFFGALSKGFCADWLVCIAYCIFWHLIGSDQLSYFS